MQIDQPLEQSSSTNIHGWKLLKRYWYFMAAGAAAIGVGIWAALTYLRPYTFNGTVVQSLEKAPDFVLESSTGDEIRLSDFEGQIVMLYFGYTYCPDICPTTLFEVKQAVELLGNRADDVQMIMISIDPERDTPERLAEYLAHFDERFVGATGTLEEVNAVATVYGIFYQKRNSGDAQLQYTLDHTSTLVVIDREGHLKLVMPPDLQAEELAEDLKHMLR